MLKENVLGNRPISRLRQLPKKYEYLVLNKIAYSLHRK